MSFKAINLTSYHLRNLYSCQQGSFRRTKITEIKWSISSHSLGEAPWIQYKCGEHIKIRNLKHMMNSQSNQNTKIISLLEPDCNWANSFFVFSFIFISWRLITLQHCSGFCHKLKWISHGFTCIPHPGKKKKAMGRDTLLMSYQNRIWYKMIVIKSLVLGRI